jgi:hypothetical protein
MAFLFIVLGWVGYVAWVMRSRESSRRVHLVVAWALLALGVLVELIAAGLRPGG